MKFLRNNKITSNFTKSFIISGVIFFVLLIIVYGLVADSQKATNEIYRNDSKVPVQLLKLERDIHGQITSTVIPNTEFYVFKVDNPDVQIGEKLITNQDGEITVSLAPGEYYFLETKPANNYTFDTDSDGNRITHYPFSVTADSTDTIEIIAYNQRLSSKLVIEKTVDNFDQSDLTQEQIDTAFEFIVNFMDDGTQIYEYTIDDSTFPISSGESLYLKHGQQAVFPNLPRGIQFVVEEVPVLGYLTQSNNHQGTIINEEVTASYVNTFNSTVGSLTITKEVTGDDIDPNKDYTFHAVINEKEYTFDLKDGESMVFENIPIGASYTVEEEDYSTDGYISIPTNYTGTMIEGNIILPFINHLDDNTNEPGSLEITKEIDDDTEEIDIDKEFIFTVTFSDLTDQSTTIIVDGEPVEISNSNNEVQILLKHGEGIVIENIPSGIKFRVEETEDIDYISTILEVEGSIVSNQTIVLHFINQKIATPLGSLSITKQIDGEVADSEKEFDFVLEIEGQPAISFTLKGGETKTFTNIPLFANYSVREVGIPDDYALVNVENGFGTLIPDAPIVTFTNRNLTPVMIEITGTKTWEIREYNPTLPNAITLYVKNGNIVVETVIVTPDENGNWTYVISVPKYDADGNEISYTIEEKEMDEWQSNVNGTDITNVYIAPISTDSIQIRKEISGDVPTENATFEFKMVGQNRAPMPEGTESTNNSKVISIVGEGTASFGDITFKRAGSYIYTITELHTGEDGYSYDTATYTLTIEVQKIQGELVIVARTLTKDQSIVDEALFINQYNSQVANEKVTISGIKTWDHGSLASQYHPESITVIVRNGGRVVLQQEVKKSDQWSWTFILNKYDANGDVINYTIDELPVAGYEKEISGFNIHNTYNPNYGNDINAESDLGLVDDSSQSGTNTSTGDETRILIWCILLLINAAIVAYTFAQYKKSKKENSIEK
jgi:Cna protein B-type domain.